MPSVYLGQWYPRQLPHSFQRSTFIQPRDKQCESRSRVLFLVLNVAKTRFFSIFLGALPYTIFGYQGSRRSISTFRPARTTSCHHERQKWQQNGVLLLKSIVEAVKNSGTYSRYLYYLRGFPRSKTWLQGPFTTIKLERFEALFSKQFRQV
jgi:hypothetical protein